MLRGTNVTLQVANVSNEGIDSLHVSPPKADELCGAFLDMRCLMARALSLSHVDLSRAQELAQAAFKGVADLSRNVEASADAPWPIREEPSLVVAFKRGRTLAQNLRDAERRLDAKLAQAESDAKERRALAESHRRQAEHDTPQAADLLAKLLAGERLSLNNHSLDLDRDHLVLAGTNAYGVDYYWGQPELASLVAWRKILLDGNDIGPVPPGCHPEECGQEELDDREAHAAWHALEDLVHMASLRFDSQLILVGLDARLTKR